MNLSTQVFNLWAHREDRQTMSVHSTKQAEGDMRIQYKLAVVEGFTEGDDWTAVVAHIVSLNDDNDNALNSAIETLILEPLTQARSALHGSDNGN